jgi:hypothetical protein
VRLVNSKRMLMYFMKNVNDCETLTKSLLFIVPRSIRALTSDEVRDDIQSFGAPRPLIHRDGCIVRLLMNIFKYGAFHIKLTSAR